jgi:hypothetical protein
MAILIMEGFEGYGSYTNLVNRWPCSSTISQTSFETGRDGVGQCIDMDFGSAAIYFPFPGGQSAANIVIGFGYRRKNNIAAGDIVTAYAYDGNTEQIVLRCDASGDLFVDRGATNLGSTTALGILLDTWYYIELVITFGDTTAGSIDLFVNGNNELSLSSIDTRQVTGENAGRLRLIGNGSGGQLFDDFYVLDDQGTDQTTRIGPCFIETVFPDADGTTNDFTAQGAGANYVEVDETTPDDDTTYNSSSTVNHKDLYGHAALTGNIGTVYAVMPRSCVATSQSGTRGVKVVARSSATEVDGAEKFIDQTYVYVDNIYENDPNGGGAWTESSVNAAEFGIKITT